MSKKLLPPDSNTSPPNNLSPSKKSSMESASLRSILILSACVGALALFITASIMYTKRLSDTVKTLENNASNTHLNHSLPQDVSKLFERVHTLNARIDTLEQPQHAEHQRGLTADEQENIFQKLPLSTKHLEQIEAFMKDHAPSSLETEKQQLQLMLLRLKIFFYIQKGQVIFSHSASSPQILEPLLEKIDATLSAMLALQPSPVLQTSLDLLRLHRKNVTPFQELYRFPDHTINQSTKAPSEKERAFDALQDTPSLPPFSLETFHQWPDILWHSLKSWMTGHTTWIKKYFSIEKHSHASRPKDFESTLVRFLNHHQLEEAQKHVADYLKQQLPPQDENIPSPSYQAWEKWMHDLQTHLQLKKTLQALHIDLLEGIDS